MLKGGKLKGLGVTTGRRAGALPEVPTMIEGGIRGYDVSSWFGVLAPTRTPRQVVDKLNAEIARILEHPQTKTRLIELGADPQLMAPVEANRFFHAEIDKWAK